MSLLDSRWNGCCIHECCQKTQICLRMLLKACSHVQGAELSMLSVSWMHLGFLDEMQLYDLAFRVCARLGSLQTLLPVYHDALQQYMSLVRTTPHMQRASS